MKFFRTKSLALRMAFICLVSLLAAAFPSFMHTERLMSSISSLKLERNGARVLNSMAVVAHNAFLKQNADAAFDSAKTKKAVSEITYYAPSLFADRNAEINIRNPRAASFFTPAALETFVSGSDKGVTLSEMGMIAAMHSGLSVDSNVDIQLHITLASSTFMQVYDGFYKMSDILRKYPAQPDRNQINELISAYSTFADDCNAMLAQLRRACAMAATEKSVVIIANLSKFNANLSEFNAAVSKAWQGKPFEAPVAFSQLSELEELAFELWSGSGNVMLDFLSDRYNAERAEMRITLWVMAITSVAVFAFALTLIILTSAAVSRSMRLANLALSGGIGEAKDFYENMPRRVGELSEIDAAVAGLLDKFSSAVHGSREAVETAAEINSEIVATASSQKPRLNGLSNAMLRIGAKISLRDKSDAALAASALALRDRLNAAEQMARSQNKSLLEVSADVKSTLESASGVIAGMEKVREAAEKMSVVAQTFTGVADQANILSLNLSIETAKSGIKGTGLGTLAEQIRVLSKRTVVSVIDIESIRDAILEYIAAGTAGAEGFLRALESNSKILSEIDSSIAELIASLSRISSSANAISVSLRERGALDVSTEDAQENIAKIDSAIAEFILASRRAETAIEGAREKISRYKI